MSPDLEVANVLKSEQTGNEPGQIFCHFGTLPDRGSGRGGVSRGETK